MKLFISHSSKDLETVKALVQCIRDAMPISPEDIRCTSLDSYRLPGGSDINDQLRAEIQNAPAFIGLISYRSVESMYVIFELGARWGAAGHLIPLLAPGVSSNLLQAPLSGLNSLSCGSEAQLHQLVDDLASQLKLRPYPVAAYQHSLKRILNLPPHSAGVPVPKSLTREFMIVPTTRKEKLSDKQREILNYLEEQFKWRASVPQLELEERYKEVYWRLEALRYQGFIEKEVAGKHNGRTVFNYRLSEDYQAWLSGR